MNDEKVSTIYEKYASVIEQNTLGTEAIIYGVSSFGLFCAMRVIRPFAKFKKPANVPNHFFQDGISIRGKVAYVSPSDGSTLLMVDHKPIVPLPRAGKDKYLPVKLSGIDVTPNGISWLQNVVVGKNVVLMPVSKQKAFVECIATLPQSDKKPLNIANELQKLGFSTVSYERQKTMNNALVKSYFQSLVKAQKWAVQNRKGYWLFNTRPTITWKIQQFLKNKLDSFLPMFKTT